MPRRYKECARLVDGHTDGITAVAFSPKGDLLATGGMDGRVCFWRVQDGKLMYYHQGDCAVLSMTWLPTKEYALMCGTKHGNIITVTISLALNDFSLSGFWAHNYPIECLAASGDFVASGAHSELKVWKWSATECTYICETELQEPPTTLQNDHHEVLVASLHWTASDSYPSLLMVTYMFHGVYLFEPTRWTRVRSIPLPGKIASASLSDDGKYLAISNIDRGFDIFVMASGEPLRSFEHEVEEPRAVPVLFIHGGQAIVGGGVVGKVNVWDIFLGKMPPLPIPARAKVLALAAYYEPGLEAKDYSFFIVTGIFNEGAGSPCIIWKAEEIVAASEHSGVAGGSPDSQHGSWVTDDRSPSKSVAYRLFCGIVITLLVIALAVVISSLNASEEL